MSKLLAGEVDEGQVVEAGGDGGVVLDEGPAAGILGEDLMNACVMAQHAAVGSERKAAEITPGKHTQEHFNISTPEAFTYMNMSPKTTRNHQKRLKHMKNIKFLIREKIHKKTLLI